mmetsp:Transcript_20426/g.24201  ORF Transcript_20426/g.24201 Transcript_20426/m.24201 type:complete len:259 (-) Transcript_20426:121-897(-)
MFSGLRAVWPRRLRGVFRTSGGGINLSLGMGNGGNFNVSAVIARLISFSWSISSLVSPIAFNLACSFNSSSSSRRSSSPKPNAFFMAINSSVSSFRAAASATVSTLGIRRINCALLPTSGSRKTGISRLDASVSLCKPISKGKFPEVVKIGSWSIELFCIFFFSAMRVLFELYLFLLISLLIVFGSAFVTAISENVISTAGETVAFNTAIWFLKVSLRFSSCSRSNRCSSALAAASDAARISDGSFNVSSSSAFPSTS